jgi:hypothetical protein
MISSCSEISFLTDFTIPNMTELERVQMALGCRDMDAIPKVDSAGALVVHAQQRATQVREALLQAQLAHSNEVQVALMSQLEQANQREISKKMEILRLRAIQKSLADRLEKGPFRLRQLVSQPKEFFRELSAYDKKQRHPRKAVGYLLRKLRKVKRFVMRQPGKSLKGGGNAQNRQIAKSKGQKGLNLSKESADANCVNSDASNNDLSPRDQRIYGLIERKIKQQKGNISCV